MLKLFSFTIILLTLVACGNQRKTSSNEILASSIIPQLTSGDPFVITDQSSDITYGTAENPIKVGGANESKGPLNERRFLNTLAGPNGEAIKYNRAGSCCPFKSKNASFGGMLDVYVITWEGQDKPTKLYINMYDEDTMKVPFGYTAKK